MGTENVEKSKGGRPSKLTPELQDAICKYLKADNYFSTTCWAVGITPVTGYAWLKKGEKEKAGKYRDFYEAVMRAEAEAEILDIACIKQGALNWQSKAWIRERRSRERWGRQQVEVIGPNGAPVKTDIVVHVVSENARSLTNQIIKGAGTE
jgi:transposase